MQAKDLIKQFKENWTSPAVVEEFMAGVEDLEASDVLKLYDHLSSKGMLADPGGFRLHSQAFLRVVEKVRDPALFLPLVRALKSTDSVPLRTVLANALPKVNHIPSHPELCAYFKSPDPQLRKVAGMVISQIGGRTTLEILGGYIREPGFPGRIEAMDALIQVAGHHAIPILADVFRFGASTEKAHALRYLGDQRFVSKDRVAALAAIGPALSDSDPRVLIQAISALSGVATEEEWHEAVAHLLDSPNLPVVKACVDGLRRFRAPITIAALERAFRIGPNVIRMAVLDTAEQIGDETILPLLVEGVQHRNITVRTRAANAISQLTVEGKIEVGRTLIWLLRSPDPQVRRMAVEIANKVKDPTGELWPKMLGFLRDADWWVRERVIDALVEMAGLELTQHMVGFLDDPSDTVRRYAIGVLARLKDKRSLGALVRTAQKDPDWWVRESAIETIGTINDERSIPYLVDLMHREQPLRRVCIEALEACKARSAASVIAALLDSEDSVDLILVIIKALATLEARQHTDALVPLLRHPDLKLRATVREVLNRWDYTSPNEGNDAQVGYLDQLLTAVLTSDADDLIIEPERRPFIKHRGRVVPLFDTVLTADQIQALIFPHLSVIQQQSLSALKDVDFSYELKAKSTRFRVNVFQIVTGLSAVFRVIKDEIPDIEQLGLPAIVRTFGDLKNGLVLVGGPTGAGKSTTLAAIIHNINKTSKRHILTLEDPIEALHKPLASHLTQREIGTHTRTFASALRATLRQDPDVILVGEMRDLPTIAFAVSAAETGHLVFGTLHTVSADTSIDRLINAFPAGQQPQVRSMIASSLRAVICQHLIQRSDGKGRVLAVEVMLNNDAVANLIRKQKTFQIPSVLATGREMGMQAMDIELMRLVKANQISLDDAYMKANTKKDFEAMMRGEDPAAPAQAAAPSAQGRPSMAPAAAAASASRPSLSAPAPAARNMTPSRPSISPGARPLASPTSGLTAGLTSGLTSGLSSMPAPQASGASGGAAPVDPRQVSAARVTLSPTAPTPAARPPAGAPKRIITLGRDTSSSGSGSGSSEG